MKQTIVTPAALVLLLLLSSLPYSEAASPVVWQPLYEPGPGGQMSGFVISPHDSRRLLVLGDMLGIGLSTNGGERWEPTFGLRSWELGTGTWHPSEPAVVWAGSMSGPVVSRDGGKTWEYRRKGFPEVARWNYSAPVDRVLFDPNDPQRLLAFGGNNRHWRSPGKPLWGAVWESTDGGEAWSRLTVIGEDGEAVEPGEGRNITCAEFAPGSSTRVYAAVAGVGFLVSEDGGRSWSPRNQGLPHRNVHSLAAHAGDPQTIWCALRSAGGVDDQPLLPGGIYRSRDGGATWEDASKGLPRVIGDSTTRTSSYWTVLSSPAAPGTLYTSDACWQSDGIFRSDDGGDSWRCVATRLPDVAQKTGAVLLDLAWPPGVQMKYGAIDPRSSDHVIFGGTEFILLSRDGGRTWIDGGAFRVSDHSWRGRGYGGLCTSTFLFHPDDASFALFQSMDAGRMWISRDHKWSWRRYDVGGVWSGGRDACIAGDTIYATFGQGGKFQGVGRSHDRGRSWNALEEAVGLPERGSAQGTGAIFADRRKPERVFLSVGGRLYHSADAGDHWSPVDVVGKECGELIGSPLHPSLLYVSGPDGVVLVVWDREGDLALGNVAEAQGNGRDGNGATFPRVLPLGGPKPSGRMTFSPDGSLYVASRPHNGNGEGGVWKWQAGSWTRLLDDGFVATIAVDPTDPKRLAAITDDNPFHDFSKARGVYLSGDGGQTWSLENAGLNVLRGPVITFNLHDPEKLVVGTGGGGFYTTRWPRSYLAPLASNK